LSATSITERLASNCVRWYVPASILFGLTFIKSGCGEISSINSIDVIRGVCCTLGTSITVWLNQHTCLFLQLGIKFVAAETLNWEILDGSLSGSS